MKEIIFNINIFIYTAIVAALFFSIKNPKQSIWPPVQKKSWQYKLIWTLFYVGFSLNALLIVVSWNTWNIPHYIRFGVGGPLAFFGGVLLVTAIITLGWKATYGLQDQFIEHGIYKYSRNPQYIGDVLLFLGVAIVANSMYVCVIHSIMAVFFVCAPLSEEGWLTLRYGHKYKNYKKTTRRF